MRIIRTVVTLLIVVPFSLVAQKPDYSTKSKKAIKKYEEANLVYKVRRDFIGALSLYEQAIAIDSNFLEARLRVASVSDFLNRTAALQNNQVDYLSKAHDSYRHVFLNHLSPKVKNEMYKYALSLYLEEEYKASSIVLEKIQPLFFKGESKYERLQFLIKSCSVADSCLKNPLSIELEKLSPEINRFGHNSKPVLTADGKTMIYSVRNNTGYIDENIVISHLNESGEWMTGQSIADNINTPMNDGMASISGDGKTLVYTHCGEKGNCDLYVSYNVGGEWTGPFNMGKGINSAGWDSEPSLSADGKVLYFSSNRGGGYGNYDIYKAKKGLNGVWGTPQNLGPTVNTAGNEVTPFVHASNQFLYFASDGHPGLGKYDLFSSTWDGRDWTTPVNLGSPINSADGEGAIYITPDFKTAYYEKTEVEASGRAHRSFIYRFNYPESLRGEYASSYLMGTVFKQDSTPVQASLVLVDLETKDTVQYVDSDEKSGAYTMVVTPGVEYALSASAIGYVYHSESIDLRKVVSGESKVGHDIYLKPLEIGSQFELKNIFFNSGSYALDVKSNYELDLVVEFLSKNKSVKIEVRGYTDNVGNTMDNKLLSSQRAKAVAEYLKSKGVYSTRLQFKGFGEGDPVAGNDTEEGRALNRRIEFRILAL